MGIMQMQETVSSKSPAEASEATFHLGLQCQPSMPLPLLPGKTYALNLRSAVAHVRLLCATLEANLVQGARCTLMTPMTPDAFFQRAGKQCSGRLQQAMRTGQLMLVTMIGDYQQNLVRFGPEILTKEWAQCGVAQGTLLIMDCAEQLFSLPHADLTMAQVNTYRQWIDAVQCSTLFIFSATFNEGQAAISHQRILDNTSGSAHIDGQRLPAPLWVDFWDTGTDILSEQRLEWIDADTPCTELTTENARHDVISHLRRLPSGWMDPLLSDSDEVFCLGIEPVTFGQPKQPKWRRVHDLIELLHATRYARTASVLIQAAKDTNWLHLAQAVHTMRQHCGTRLRIVILDRANIMRYQNELLLLRLGANTVLHGEAALTRLPLLLQSLLFQEYVNSKAISFEKAMISATPSSTKGYLAPEGFYREVLSALAKSRVLGVPYALLILPIPSGQDKAAFISQFHVSRQGDVMTANRKQCYVFLYGYAGSDLQALLPRLPELHNPGAMQDIALVNDEEAIVAALSLLNEEDGEADHALRNATQSCAPFNARALSAT